MICGKPLLTWGQSWSEAEEFYSGGDRAAGFHSDPNYRASKEMSICANSESVNVPKIWQTLVNNYSDCDRANAEFEMDNESNRVLGIVCLRNCSR